MTAKLTKELAAALNATGESELEVVDPDTQRTYFLVDSETHRRAMDALHRQQDRDAIAQGIAEMEQARAFPSPKLVNSRGRDFWLTGNEVHTRAIAPSLRSKTRRFMC